MKESRTGGWLYDTVNVVKATGLYTYKWLKLDYVYDASLFFFFF